MAEVHSEVAREVESSRSVARAVWGLLLVWAGTVALLQWGWGVGLVGAGVILLGAQAVRRHLELRVDGFGLIAGALLVICGAGSLFQIAFDLFPLLVIAAGVVLLLSVWTSRARQGAPRDAQASSHPRP